MTTEEKNALIDYFMCETTNLNKACRLRMFLRGKGYVKTVSYYKIEIFNSKNELIAFCERRYSKRKINLCYPELKHIWFWADGKKVQF